MRFLMAAAAPMGVDAQTTPAPAPAAAGGAAQDAAAERADLARDGRVGRYDLNGPTL